MSNEHLERSFGSYEQIIAGLIRRGCTSAFLKPLALNQDNDKNQIYFGGASLLTQLLPGTMHFRDASASTEKRASKAGSSIVEVQLRFSWLWPNGVVEPVPGARLINYFQYPEIRFSGFLKGCAKAPRALRRTEQDPYGRRVLLIGVAGDECFGIVVTDVDGKALVDQLLSLPTSPIHSLLKDVPLGDLANVAINRGRLLEELREIIAHEYPPMVLDRVDDEPRVVAGGTQFGGWTLEALMGIPRNGIAEPDKYGFELKTVSGSKVSVITSEADIGYRAEAGFKAFMKRYGRMSPKTPGKVVFNGIHRCGQRSKSTGALLTIDHWDLANHRPTGEGEPTVLLLDDQERAMAGWSFTHLGEHWAKKHAGAAYVETRGLQPGDSGYASGYVFGPQVGVGLGTSVLHLLGAVSRGTVHLDPGDRVNEAGAAKARTQWRVNGTMATTLAGRLATLYDRFEMIDLSASSP